MNTIYLFSDPGSRTALILMVLSFLSFIYFAYASYKTYSESKQFEKDMVELGAEAPVPNAAVKALSSIKEEAKKMPKMASETKEKVKKAAPEKGVSSIFNRAPKKKGKKTILPAPKKGDPLLEDYVDETQMADTPPMEVISLNTADPVPEETVDANAPVQEPVYMEEVHEEELVPSYEEEIHDEEPAIEIMDEPVKAPVKKTEKKPARKKAPAKKPVKSLFGGKKEKRKAEKPAVSEPIEDNDEDIIEMIDIDQMIAEEEDNG